MKRINQIFSYFRLIRWRYLILLIAVYVICSIGHDAIGHNFDSLSATVWNGRFVYLIMVIVYVIASIVKQVHRKTI